MKKIKTFLWSYLGEFLLVCVAFIGTGILAAHTTNIIWSVPFWIILVGIVIFILWNIAYAWIINPIRSWQQKRADKKKEA